MSNAVAILHRDEIISQVAQGTMLHRVAKLLGVQAPAISKHLSKDPEYIQARETGAELRLHLAYERIDECAEGETIEEEDGQKVRIAARGNLAHAREAAFKAAAWFAEREFPERWGQKGTTINVLVNVSQADAQLAGSITDLIPAVHQTVEKP